MPRRDRSASAVARPLHAEDLDGAGVGREEPFADFDGRGLSGAVGAEETEALAGADLEVERVDGDDVGVGLTETANREREWRSGSSGHRGKLTRPGKALLAASSCWLFADGCSLLPLATGCCYVPQRAGCHPEPTDEGSQSSRKRGASPVGTIAIPRLRSG